LKIVDFKFKSTVGNRASTIPRKLLHRKPTTHKGDYGHLLIIAGSKGLTGAPVLSAQAALRSGAGLISLAVPETVYSIVARKAVPEVMVHALPDSGRGSLSSGCLVKLKRLMDRADVLAVGPGLSKTAGTRNLVRRLLVQQKQPMVIDADGIAALKGLTKLRRLRGAGAVVITPHPGEMALLTGMTTQAVQKDRKAIAVRIAKKLDCVVVLKGHHTLIASPNGTVRVNSSGNPGMATGGMGDVLTGMIAALIGQDLEPEVAAAVGVYFHGVAGDLAARKVGEVGLTATDVIDQIPAVFKKAARRAYSRP